MTSDENDLSKKGQNCIWDLEKIDNIELPVNLP